MLPLFASQMSDGEMYIQSLMIEWWKFKAEETGQLTLFSALRKKAKVKTPQLQEVDSKRNENSNFVSFLQTYVQAVK